MNDFKEKLKKLMNEYAHLIYHLTKNFPKEELYGLTSQIRRSSLSIILNYVEGYGRRRPASQLNFYEMSLGSFNESRYLFNFSKDEDLIKEQEYVTGIKLLDEIGAMLWAEIDSLDKLLKR
jgi:four helix bundle protein